MVTPAETANQTTLGLLKWERRAGPFDTEPLKAQSRVPAPTPYRSNHSIWLASKGIAAPSKRGMMRGVFLVLCRVS